MANDNNIKIFTAADIEKYHTGQLSPREMHDLEKAALDDSFLADALEGYATPGVLVNDDIAELKKRLANKTESAKVIPMHTGGKTSLPWLRIAVMIVVLAGAGTVAYQVFKPLSSEKMALNKSKETEPVKPSNPVVEPPNQKNGDTTFLITVPADATSEKSAEGSVAAGKATVTNQSVEYFATKPDSLVIIPGIGFKDEIAKAPAKIEAAEKIDDLKKVTKPDNEADKTDFAAKEYSKATAVNPATRSEDFAYKSKEGALRAKGITNNNRLAEGYINNNIFRGRVTDNNNNPLPFANIINTTDNVGTYTDAKGNFALISPYDSVMNVQVRALGFEQNRLQLRSDVSANQVMLQEDRSMAPRILDTVKRNFAKHSREGNMSFDEPEPADGWSSYDSYLANNNNLHDVPEAYDVKKNTSSDAVELSFEVNKNGDPVNIRIEKSLCDKCDKEAIRLVKEGPKWKRKAKKGKRTTVTVPFVKSD